MQRIFFFKVLFLDKKLLRKNHDKKCFDLATRYELIHKTLNLIIATCAS